MELFLSQKNFGNFLELKVFLIFFIQRGNALVNNLKKHCMEKWFYRPSLKNSNSTKKIILDFKNPLQKNLCAQSHVLAPNVAPHKGPIVLLTSDTEIYFSRSRSTQLFTTYRTVINAFAQRTEDRNRVTECLTGRLSSWQGV